MTTRLPEPRSGLAGPTPEPAGPTIVHVAAYAAAVTDLLNEVAAARWLTGAAGAEEVLARRLTEPDFAAVLGATPAGHDRTAEELLRQARELAAVAGAGRPSPLRTLLLSLIETAWWGRLEPYWGDADLLCAEELVDLAGLHRAGRLGFRYRMQPTNLTVRLVRALERRGWPGLRPRTAGMRFGRARPELVTALNRMAEDFAAHAPTGTPPLWLNSATRSVEHQLRLAALGYPAVLPSAHCVGYAADLEIAWFKRYRADQALAQVLWEWRAAGDLNVIDEGQVWHVCLHPDAAARMAGLRGRPGPAAQSSTWGTARRRSRRRR